MARSRRSRILIVDDSAVMRSLLRAVVSSDPTLEVVGTAADGASALLAMTSLRPDLVLLDVEMPVVGGLETLRTLRARSDSTPVVMVSGATHRGARVTIEALACGASDYVAKPANQSDREAALRTFTRELLPKIKALTLCAPGPSPRPLITAYPKAQASLNPPAVIVIGVSTGGPAALDLLLSAIPGSFPLPVLIVQHMPELFTGPLAERLSRCCQLRVLEAVEGAPVLAGNIHMARGDWHMEIVAAARVGSPPTLHIHRGPLENHCRPAVDVLFRSAAAVYGAATLAVVLTGMGSDGLASCRIIRSLGGTVLAQDQATSTVWGMPGAVAQAGFAHRVLPLAAIAPEILRLVSRPASERRELHPLVGQR